MKFKVGLSTLTVLFLGILFFSFSWRNPFVFDDILKIQENADLKPGSSITETLLYPYTENTTQLLRNDPSRPLTFLIYRLCYTIGDGKPWPFHAASTLFHCLNALWILLIARWMIKKLFSSENLLPVTLGAMLFLFLPINSGTVFYAFAFSDVIASFFLLGALYVFIRRNENSWQDLILPLVFFVCALFSKQSAVILPALLVGTDLLLRQVSPRRILAYIPFVILTVAYIAFRFVFFGGIGDLEGRGNTHEALQYLAMQGPVILKYLQLSIVPWGLSLDHAPNPAEFGSAEIAISWFLVLIATGLSFYFLLKKSGSRITKFLAWSWLFFLITLLPTSSFFPTVDLLVERRVYFSSAALAILFGGTLSLVPVVALRNAAGALIVLLLAVVSWGRSEVYSSPEKLWQESAALYPSSKRAHVNLGVIYDAQGRYDEAMVVFENVLHQFPRDAFVHTKLALIYQNPKYQGYNPQLAIASYQRALELNPDDIVTLFNAGLLMLDAGNFDQAEEFFRHSLKIHPRFPNGLMGLGMTLVKKGRVAEGISELQKSLTIDPQLTGAQDLLRQIQRSNPSSR